MGFSKDFKKCKTDTARWQLIIDNQELGITIMLDNDDTFVTFDGDEDEDCLTFTDYIGNSYGVVELLEAVGIKCEHV